MKPIDVFILIVAVAIVAGVVVLSIVRKKQGKPVGCDCSSCSGNCAQCSSAKPKDKN